ncbi:uncharacterized protein LOC143550003 [Bidens hawaiensis]|uniref:uncharacterized protein LOC143550003 n=1 Tax=Bidens hawaiensis TaxID=980011 RepID=UPI00404B54BF
MGGSNFTYMSDVGFKFSKIDRVLVCHEFLSKWSTASLLALPKLSSDHRPLLLSCTDLKFGPRPFRFFNSWLRNNDLIEVITNALAQYTPHGPPDFRLATKLKRCKTWRQNEQQLELGRARDLGRLLEELDLKAEKSALTEEEINTRQKSKMELAELHKCRLLDLKQRARIRWAIEGDENSSFFHAPDDLKENIKSLRSRLGIDQYISTTDSQADAESLIEPFSKAEIKRAVWDCGGEDQMASHLLL